MEKSIFGIQIYDSTNEMVDNGTGFIINKDGYFISAGHVFEIEENKYFAKIQNIKVPIKLIHTEYKNQENQVSPYYMDLVIGKLCLNSIEIKPLKFSKSIEIGAQYFACGYAKTLLIPNDKKIITEGELFADDNDEYFKDDLKYNQLPYKVTSKNISRFFKGNLIIFENGFSIKEIKFNPKGLSGGPILEQKLIKGMLITIDNCIKSEYIVKILDTKKIEYYLI